jgi:aerobic carbon-monoxide dehydrogenase small subunit
MSEHVLRFEVNGQPQEVTVQAHHLLIDLLRERLGLSGTKEACSIGVCGACSVLVDGRVVSACLMPAVMVDGARIQTVEGLAAPDGTPTPLQEAFIRHGGFQCGICTPGQLMAATALLHERPNPTEEEVRRWLMGNLCRCTGYYQIVEAVLAALGAPVTSPRCAPSRRSDTAGDQGAAPTHDRRSRNG